MCSECRLTTPGRGALDAPEVFADDEVGQLATIFNQLADNIVNSETALAAEARQTQLLTEIALVRHSQELESSLNQFLAEVRATLKADRVVLYKFDENWQGTVTPESVTGGWPKALGVQIADPCFAEKYVGKYKQGRIKATSNIYEAGLSKCHLKQLEPFAVKASLVTPVVLGRQTDTEDSELIGLLIAHQCSGARNWQQSESDYLARTASQLGISLSRYMLLEQQRAAAEREANKRKHYSKKYSNCSIT